MGGRHGWARATRAVAIAAAAASLTLVSAAMIGLRPVRVGPSVIRLPYLLQVSVVDAG